MSSRMTNSRLAMTEEGSRKVRTTEYLDWVVRSTAQPLAGGDGGAAAADGGPAAELRWRRFPAAARAFHARAKGGFLEARTASSGLRLRRTWCLRLRLDERNTMMGLDARDSQRLRSYG
ncbi:hypothetical protein F2Q69_00034491 [Brassica cretica]|uniref:Uncharacterized protein n=1 Tax=Brassica cretica TaxID=69181 RepID=A0A8S9SSE5_BRACR|nr:hypothetical protein F2Q69_00034491 [Brassica cretica]